MMKKIFRFSSLAILSLAFMATKCGEEEIQPPSSLDPFLVSMEEALTSDTVLDLTVMIDSVFFVDPAGTQFNSTTSNAGGTRVIKDCAGNSLDVFTSTDREFAYQEIATGMGRIYGIISEFQGNRQLLLRSIEDISEMTGGKCAEKTTLITVAQFNTGDYLGQVVRIEDVQFVTGDVGNEFNGTSSNANGSKTLTDCSGEELTVFTGTDSPLTNELVPGLNGYIIGEANEFGTTKQLLLRTTDDLLGLTEPECTIGSGVADECNAQPNTTYLSKDFDDSDLNSGGWITVIDTGTTDWFADDFSGDFYAKATNYDNGTMSNTIADAWLISPSVDLSSATAPLVSFTNLANFDGAPVQLMISSDYTGSGDPDLANWTDITSGATLDTDLGAWGDFLCSTNIDITAHKSATTYIAFVYTGSDSQGSTWEIDNILIKE